MHVLAGGLVLGHCISLLYSCTAVPRAVWVHLAHGSCSCGVVSTSLYTLYTPYAVRYANNVRLTLYYQINTDAPPPSPSGPGLRAQNANQLFIALDEAGEPWGATTYTRGPLAPRGWRRQPPDGSDGQGGRHAESPDKEKG